MGISWVTASTATASTLGALDGPYLARLLRLWLNDDLSLVLHGPRCEVVRLLSSNGGWTTCKFFNQFVLSVINNVALPYTGAMSTLKRMRRGGLRGRVNTRGGRRTRRAAGGTKPSIGEKGYLAARGWRGPAAKKRDERKRQKMADNQGMTFEEAENDVRAEIAEDMADQGCSGLSVTSTMVRGLGPVSRPSRSE